MAKRIIIKRKEKYKTTSIRISKNLLEKLNKLSHDSKYSRSELINIILENSIDIEKKA